VTIGTTQTTIEFFYVYLTFGILPHYIPVIHADLYYKQRAIEPNIFHRAIHLWNSLPDNIVTAPNIRNFCTELDMYLQSI